MVVYNIALHTHTHTHKNQSCTYSSFCLGKHTGFCLEKCRGIYMGKISRKARISKLKDSIVQVLGTGGYGMKRFNNRKHPLIKLSDVEIACQSQGFTKHFLSSCVYSSVRRYHLMTLPVICRRHTMYHACSLFSLFERRQRTWIIPFDLQQCMCTRSMHMNFASLMNCGTS